jgi:hypothetical protein
VRRCGFTSIGGTLIFERKERNTMKTALAATLFTFAAVATASAQGAPQDPNCCQPGQQPALQPAAQPAPTVAYAEPAGAPLPAAEAPLAAPPVDSEEGWGRPVGRRFMHGFRLGWTYIYNMDKPTRDGGMSLAQEFELKSPNMMLLGYEGFYRIVGHSWLNVLLVGNVTVAGLEQSKFIPAASGLIGMEIDRAFQIGVGVNATPDPQSPTHMIAAAGWTPKVGAINTPIHFFFVPDTEGNHRMGATLGLTW